ncbi:MAG: hypothetical protein ACLPXZ_16320 [Mycobacterium sp.]
MPDLAAVKDVVSRHLLTAGLIYGGLFLAAVAVFLPWITVNVKNPLGFGDLGHQDYTPFGGILKLLALLMIAGAMALAWFILSESQKSAGFLIGLSAVTGLLICGFLLGLINYFGGVAEKGKGGEGSQYVDVSIDFGMFLYFAAVAAVAVGVLRIWMQRSKPAGQV